MSAEMGQSTVLRIEHPCDRLWILFVPRWWESNSQRLGPLDDYTIKQIRQCAILLMIWIQMRTRTEGCKVDLYRSTRRIQKSFLEFNKNRGTGIRIQKSFTWNPLEKLKDLEIHALIPYEEWKSKEENMRKRKWERIRCLFSRLRHQHKYFKLPYGWLHSRSH